MMTSKLVCECGVVNDNDARYCKMCGLGKDDKRSISVIEDFRKGSVKLGATNPYAWEGVSANG